MKILVCGDRNWLDGSLILRTLYKHSERGWLTVIHGGCRGADLLAGTAARSKGWQEVIVPANWKRYGRAAGPIRNAEMLKLQPDLVLAFHDHLEESKGTNNMIEQARKAGVKVIHISH